MRTVKTFEDWNCNLDEYLQIGDLVDEQMADYFLDVLPPATFTSRCIQMGEPYSHIRGRATFSTLAKTDEGWMYVGHCYRGEITTPEEEHGH